MARVGPGKSQDPHLGLHSVDLRAWAICAFPAGLQEKQLVYKQVLCGMLASLMAAQCAVLQPQTFYCCCCWFTLLLRKPSAGPAGGLVLFCFLLCVWLLDTLWYVGLNVCLHLWHPIWMPVLVLAARVSIQLTWKRHRIWLMSWGPAFLRASQIKLLFLALAWPSLGSKTILSVILPCKKK